MMGFKIPENLYTRRMKNRFLTTLLPLLFLSALPAQEIIDLGEITTYVSSPVAEQKIIIKCEDIEAKHISDFPTLLQSYGIQLLSYGSYGLETKPSLRGFTDETVRVIIDGVCVNNAQYGTFDFSTININNIEKIEIIKGGFTEGINDEDAVGGAIYITTKKMIFKNTFSTDSAITTYFNTDTFFDTFSQSFNMNLNLSENDFLNLYTKGTFAQNQYLYLDDNKNERAQTHAKVLDGNLDFNLIHYYGNANSATVSNLFYAGDKNCPGTITSTNYGKQKDYTNNLTITLLNPYIKNCLKLQNTISFLYSKRLYDDDFGHSDHNVYTIKYSSLADFYKFDFFTQSVSVTFDFTHLDSTDDGMHNQFSLALKETSKVFFNDIYSLSLPLTIKICNENFAFVPKLGFRGNYKYINVILNGYRMIQFPNMDDLYWNGSGFYGNPNLKPEKGWGAELGFEFNMSVPAKINFFTNYYEDKIQWSGNTVKNIASAFYFGIDWDVEKSFLNNALVLKFNGEYLYTSLLDKSNEYTYGNQIMLTPDFVGSLLVDYNFANGNVGIEANYVGKRYCSNLNASYLEPYFLLNMHGELNIQKSQISFSPYFRINNLLNWNYQSVENYSMPGINASLGCKLQW